MNTGDFRLLYYFAEIAAAGSIRGASRKLRLSPAVVSTALSDLEAAVSATLITRTTRQMTLTDAGRALLPKATQAVIAVEAAMKTPGVEAARISGNVSVNLPTELASTWFPPLLTRFNANFPAVRTSIHADDMQVQLASSGHDMSLRTEFRAMPASGPDVATVLPLVLVCSAELRKTLTDDLQDSLRRIDFIGSDHQIPNGTLYAQDEKSGAELALQVKSGFNINNRQVALELTRQGFGAALLISTSAEQDIRNGTLARLGQGISFGYVVVRVVMRDRMPSPAAKAMRDLILAKDV